MSNMIVGAFLEQVPVQAGHQIKIFTDGARPIAADGAHQIRSKQAKRPGNNRQHISLRPGFPANQEGAEILDDLDDFDALARQTYPPQSAALYLRPVQHANDSAYRNDAFWIRQDGNHDAQQRVTFKDRVSIHDANVWRSHRVQTGIYGVRLAASGLLVNDQQSRVDIAPVQSAHRRALRFWNVHRADLPKAKLFAQFLKSAIFGSIVVNDGSKDRTLEELREEFRLRQVRAVDVPEAKSAPVRGLYRCELHHR